MSSHILIQNETKCSEESRKHIVDVTEILRFALDDKTKFHD